MCENVRLTKLVKKQLAGKTQPLSKAMSLLIISAQLSELVKMVGQVPLVHVVISLFLLVIIVATKTGTEGEAALIFCL